MTQYPQDKELLIYTLYTYIIILVKLYDNCCPNYSVGGSEVVLTDGNSDSVENLQQIISRNQDLSLSAEQYRYEVYI